MKLLFLLLLGVSTNAMAQDSYVEGLSTRVDEQTPTRTFGGAADIPSGSWVEGSVDHGGLQPHYIVDFEAPEFRPLREYAQGLKTIKEPLRRAQLMREYVSGLIIHKGYTDPTYLGLLKQYRDLQRSIPLSAYVKSKAGVCRELGLILHLALKEAGIENFYVYASVFKGTTIEDHALTIFLHQGEWVVVDSYDLNFHGQKLADLLRSGGTYVDGLRVGIQKIPDYPVIERPQLASYKTYHPQKGRRPRPCFSFRLKGLIQSWW